jgi:hypothetical protein
VLNVFPRRELEELDKQFAEFTAAPRLVWDEATLARAARLVRVYQPQRQALRTALARPHDHFGAQLTHGYFDEQIVFVTAVSACVRLEGLAAGEALLGRQRPSDAADSLHTMLELVERLAAESHPAARFRAAVLRTEALRVAGAVALHPAADRGLKLALLARLRRQLDRWPADDRAWIGDRALGLHAYEVIRAGHFSSLASEDDFKSLKDEGRLRDLGLAVTQGLDDDELFYLRAMRRIIHSCAQPYYLRRAMLDQLERERSDARGSDAYPLIADRFLLTRIDENQRLVAQDRALCEAWVLALAVALGEPRPKLAINPLTGQPYRLVEAAEAITVADVTPDGTSVVIPRLKPPG